jgi:hypothetical protein
MPIDSLNQVAWAFMQDWMNKKNQAYSLENMKAQQQGWMDYQKEGSNLELQRMADQLQAQKEAAVFMKLLGLDQMDDPSAIRAMEIINAAAQGNNMGYAVPDTMKSLVPGMREGSDILSSIMPKLLTGDVEGVDWSSAMRSGGGIQNILRAAEMGTGRRNLDVQIPGQRANALANLFSSQGKGGPTAAKIDSNMFTIITKTKDDLDRIYSKFLPSGSRGATADEVLGFVMELMPKDMNKKPEQQQADASKWILGVGLEFFDDLENMVQNIWIRAGQGEITVPELRIIADAASPYRMATKYKRTKEQLVSAFAEKYAKTPIIDPTTKAPLDIANLFNKPVDQLTDMEAQVRQSMVSDIWKAMYGGQ